MRLFKRLINMGFAHIFSSNLINKFVLFGINIVIVRLISQSEYGQFAYARNILNMIMLLQGLGVVDGLLQFASETEEIKYRKAYFEYSIKFGISFNAILSLATILMGVFVNFKIAGSNKILVLLALTPLLSLIYGIITIYLRVNLLNKYFSKLTMINTISYFLFTVILGYVFGVTGIIIANYLAFIISIVIGIKFLKESDLKIKSEKYILSKVEKIRFIKFSATASVTNCISQMLYLLDTFLIGVIISSPIIIAIYKNATLIPFNLTFIPLSIMIFIYPYFAKRNKDKIWIRDKYKKLICGLFAVNVIIVAILWCFSPLIISILFGNEYLEAVPTFRILLIGYIVAGTFRIPAGNILFALKKVKINFYNSMITGIANIILDIVLIYKYGHIGAAIATVCVFILSSIISNIYIYYYLYIDDDKEGTI